MINRTVNARLDWMLNRLSCMSAAEVFHRFSHFIYLKALKFRLVPFFTSTAVKSFEHRVLIQPFFTDVNKTGYLQEADAILDGKVVLFSDRMFDVGCPPIWNQDPLTGIVSPSSFGPDISITKKELVGDIKHVWEINRHIHLVRLAQAYVLSGDPRYLDSLSLQLNSWLEDCPPLIGINWTSSLELGIRLINWSLIWQILDGWNGPLFKGDAGERLRSRWMDSVFAHCQFISTNLSRYSSANNHLIGELAGLYIASLTWPYWPQSSKWALLAKKGLEREIAIQYSTDGVNREQAFAYQIFATEFLVIAGIYGHRSGEPFSSEFWDSLSKIFCFIRSVRDVHGHAPMFGDADDGIVHRLEPGGAQDRAAMMLSLSDVILGNSSTEQWTDTARWLLGEGGSLFPHQTSSALTNWRFPEGGYFLFGSDFSQANEIKGILDCGSLGYLGIAAHGHADALAISLSVCGEECLIDSGTYSYWNKLEWREYFRGTSAHNTVTVDNTNQSASGGRFMWTRKAVTSVEKVPVSPEKFDFAGSHGGYMRLPDPVRHKRSIHYDSSEKIVKVRDEVFGISDHKVEQFWHFSPEMHVELDGSNAFVSGKRFKMTISFLGENLKIALFYGSEQPILGWMSRAYESKVPSPTLQIQTKASKSVIEARFGIEIF